MWIAEKSDGDWHEQREATVPAAGSCFWQFVVSANWQHIWHGADLSQPSFIPLSPWPLSPPAAVGLSTCHMQMTCLSNKVKAVCAGGVWSSTLQCVCAIFTLFQYYTYIKLSSTAAFPIPPAKQLRSVRVRIQFRFSEFGFGFGFGFRVGAECFRLRPLQVCTSNVRKLNFSWLSQMLVFMLLLSVCVYVCVCERMCFCGLLRRLQAVLV